MRMTDPEFEAWVQRARDVPVQHVADMLGARLRRAGGELVGACPHCGGDDRFAVNVRDQVFVCRGSGAGGDGISMVQHVNGCEFTAAVEYIVQEPPPRRDSKAEPEPINHASEKERRDDRREHDRAEQEKRQAEEARKASDAERLLDKGVPIFGTHAEAYFRARKITVSGHLFEGCRFIASLAYRGYRQDGEDREDVLGEWPCILWPMVDTIGRVVGVHRTYLDRREPKKREIDRVTLASGKRADNLAKKMFGRKGLIRIGPVREIMAVAEGVETALSWLQLAFTNDDCAIAAAGDLGVLSGGSTGAMPHPTLHKRVIPNGIPDPDRPGMAIPDQVKELIIIGDGDSDPANTRAHILTAARRHHGLGRRISIHMAPDGQDWNDVLMSAPEGVSA